MLISVLMDAGQGLCGGVSRISYAAVHLVEVIDHNYASWEYIGGEYDTLP
jgi:hypothetical protein